MGNDISPAQRVFSERISKRPEQKSDIAEKNKDKPIGIFDSGVGGLTVFSEFIKILPHEDVIYLADTARVPYGGRPYEEILEINRGILDYFKDRGVKMVIMACGTSSSMAYPALKDNYEFPIISLIEPGARSAVAASKNGRIGVIATQGTIKSNSYNNKIKELKKEAEVFSEACPLFVPLIEGGFIDSEETRKTARGYLAPLIAKKIDTLVLGCTHYPHLKRVISEIVGLEVALIDPAIEAVEDAKKILSQNHLLSNNKGSSNYEYVVTGPPLHFQELGSKLLGRSIPRAHQIKL
ncbi:MAG: glutamate racemase [Candidatus Saganbacteria bacterium]|uniref:Glutamate racemase n=1 Tax=Candidatus Saganbacteria bacterium TaxID=2575572 RepID=A0A833L1J8_UNCSA|nr:MAG: glutamate racemase [Candidatus Saganbacteria bacterium]